MWNIIKKIFKNTPSVDKHELGKNIVIVGNSPNVLETEFGEIINTFDTVIRINNYETDGFKKHVGDKTDFIFLSFACPKTDNIRVFNKYTNINLLKI